MVAHLYYLALKIGDGVIEDGGFICTLYTVLYSMHRRHNVTIVTTWYRNVVTIVTMYGNIT